MSKPSLSFNKILEARYPELTSKGKELAKFVSAHPDKAVFLTTRKLAAEVGVSEATVVRFVKQLDYPSYSAFIKALRDHIDTELTLIERGRLAKSEMVNINGEFARVTHREMENIRALGKSIDQESVTSITKLLKNAPEVHVIGARLSYAPAHYMGWTLSKVRKRVQILNGSDNTAIDRLTLAEANSAVVVIATSRYPNELIRIGKYVKRQQLDLILLTDSTSCPLTQFSDQMLIAPSKSIPFLDCPTSLMVLINGLIHTLAGEMGDALKDHQERLEQAYLENDILFNY